MSKRTDLQSRIRELREELNNRYEYGTIKIAASDGTPVPTKDLQTEMFNLIYKLSKID